jgi:acetyl-CoA synthetase
LVIREPWIGMARGFYKDPERYIETYWTRFPGMWAHGDWASIDEDGHWFIHGRSDDTIKVAGKRVGPAEVESILVSHQCIAEAAVIAIPDERKGNAIAAFCVLKVGEVESAERETELCNLVATELGKPLRPERLHFLAALPRTRNAKVMRRVLRAAYLDEDPGDLSPLENPQTLEAIRALRR